MNKMLSALLYITLTSASAHALPPNHTIKVSPTSSSPLFYVFLMGNKSCIPGHAASQPTSQPWLVGRLAAG